MFSPFHGVITEFDCNWYSVLNIATKSKKWARYTACVGTEKVYSENLMGTDQFRNVLLDGG
jgi:hypothetical protein